jgi:hypothetical protein
MTGEPALADAIAKVVADYPTRKVPLADVLAAAASVDHTAASAVGWRTRVLAAITSLGDEGLVEIPKTRFDRSANPPLPAYVKRPATTKPTPAEEASIIWHVDLDWVARADDADALSAAERRFLAKVNAWLPRRRDITVPLRERSLDIFDDDKLLESWIFGPLFRPNRLTLALLACETCWPPVEQRVLGPGDWLIVENYTTYVSIGRRAAGGGFDGRIVWGSGLQVGTRLSALAAAGERPARCWYFGDIDVGGFRAARLACVRAGELGFGPVRPARGLYELAVRFGFERRRTGGRHAGEDLVNWALDWLGGALGEIAATVTRAGDRIVQENVGAEVLAGVAVREWLVDEVADGSG